MYMYIYHSIIRSWLYWCQPSYLPRCNISVSIMMPEKLTAGIRLYLNIREIHKIRKIIKYKSGFSSRNFNVTGASEAWEILYFLYFLCHISRNYTIITQRPIWGPGKRLIELFWEKSLRLLAANNFHENGPSIDVWYGPNYTSDYTVTNRSKKQMWVQVFKSGPIKIVECLRLGYS